MKKFLFTIAFISFIFIAKGQQILFQDFSNSTTGWITSQGSSIGLYENFFNSCIEEYGIITPGVGGNNPAKVLSQIITPNHTLVEVQFDINRYNSNLKCNTHSNFGCPTTVDILAVASTYTGTDPIGDGTTIYANYSGYLLPIAGGTVSLIVQVPGTLPDFRMYFNFSTDNCLQTGTKYVLDKFVFTGYEPCQIANTCPPVAKNDYFNSGIQNFGTSTLLANVYGTNLGYTPLAPHTAYVTRSINNLGISEDGGKDLDIDNHLLSVMTFTLLSQTFINGTDANLIFNADGTFSFQRINTSINQFFFNYRLTDPQGNYDDATVRIDYSTGGPLPVKLVNFKAQKVNSGSLLSWETAQELNNKGFDILRKTNGSFEKIGFVASKAQGGYSNSTLSYTFEDYNLPTDKSVYYRLAQVDIDGKEFYSDIRVITNGDKKQPLLVYPNPSRGNLQIIIPSDLPGLSDVRIFNATGSVVYNINNTADKRIDIKGLQSGFYIIKVISQTDNTVFIKKLIVQ